MFALPVRIADNAGAINEYSWLEKCRAAHFLTSYHGGNHHIRDDAYPAPAHAQRRAAQRRAGEVLSAGNPALATIATRRTPYGSFNFNVLLLT